MDGFMDAIEETDDESRLGDEGVVFETPAAGAVNVTTHPSKQTPSSSKKSAPELQPCSYTLGGEASERLRILAFLTGKTPRSYLEDIIMEPSGDKGRERAIRNVMQMRAAAEIE